MSPTKTVPLTTSVLFIDGNPSDRACFTDKLKGCALNCQILEAPDGDSGLNQIRSQRVDCVVTELNLPDKSGLEILADIVSVSSIPQVALIVLTRIAHRTVGELAKEHGAYACLVKQHTSGQDLAKTIQRALAFVRLPAQ